MSPQDFMRGACKCTQVRRVTIDEELFLIISTFRMLDYLSWNGLVLFFTIKIWPTFFQPVVTGTALSKATQHNA